MIIEYISKVQFTVQMALIYLILCKTYYTKSLYLETKKHIRWKRIKQLILS